MAQLTEDVISEILFRLPIKTMFACKSVCKTWNTLISDVCLPRISRGSLPLTGFLFCARKLISERKHYMDYLSYSSENDFPYVYNRKDFTYSAFVNSYASLLPSEYSPYEVRDCCNGLILLVSQSVPRYFVCNPATKQCLALPKSSAQVKVCDAALAFNPSESSHFKVVCFIYTHPCPASNPPKLDIFCSETRKWIRHWLVVKSPVVYGVSWDSWLKRTIYLDRMLYKLTLSKHLLRINLKMLTVQVIELPSEDKADECGFIGVSKGAFVYANNNGSRILIWQLDCCSKAGHFWILKHCICVYDLMFNDPAGWYEHMLRRSSMFKPYAIHPTSDIIFLGIPEMILSYKLGSEKLELLVYYCRPTMPCSEICLDGYCFYPYMRCFTMMNDINELNKQQILPIEVAPLALCTKENSLSNVEESPASA